MNEIQPPKSQPTQLPNPIQSSLTHQPLVQPSKTPPQSPPPPKPTRSTLSILWTALIMFILGIIGGILLFATYPKSTTKPQSPPPTNLITTPTIFPSTPTPASSSADLATTPASSISASSLPTGEPTTTPLDTLPLSPTN